MFENGFATIRNFILEHSNRIVQDDSGIPVAYFDPNKWNLRLFGAYLGPIDLFKQHHQPRLAGALRAKQSAAARLRIRLSLELQGSQFDGRRTEVTADVPRCRQAATSVPLLTNFKSSR